MSTDRKSVGINVVFIQQNSWVYKRVELFKFNLRMFHWIHIDVKCFQLVQPVSYKTKEFRLKETVMPWRLRLPCM